MPRQAPKKDLLSHECPEFIAAIHYFKDEQGWSNVALADALGIATNTISLWLKGEYHPTVLYVRRLCEVFDVDLETFWQTGCRIVETERGTRLHHEKPDEIVEALMSHDARTVRKVLEKMVEALEADEE